MTTIRHQMTVIWHLAFFDINGEPILDEDGNVILIGRGRPSWSCRPMKFWMLKTIAQMFQSRPTNADADFPDENGGHLRGMLAKTFQRQ